MMNQLLMSVLAQRRSDLEEDPYAIYALDIYKKSNLENIFTAAWKHSLTVDPSQIERESYFGTYYGTLQYPNGEYNGVIIPNSVTSIGESAFRSWTSNDRPLVIPNSVTSIGESAFRQWSSNNQPLVIPNSVTSIGDNAFVNWNVNNQPLVIPDSVTSIGKSAFSNWFANSQPLVIPDSVTSLGTAFWGWEKVPYIVMEGSTPPTLSNAEGFGRQNDAPIYVPDESVTAYKAATNWSALSGRIFSINEK